MNAQCPCGKGKLIIKKGKWSSFYGCTRYPECMHTEKIGFNGNPQQLGPTDPESIQARETLVRSLQPYYGKDITAINDFIRNQTGKPSINYLQRTECEAILKKIKNTA